MTKSTTKQKRKRRKQRVRAQIEGTPNKPRLSVYRSLNNIYAQLIDDANSETIASADSREDLDGDAGDREAKLEEAYLVGLAIADRAQEKNIDQVVFDRGEYKYHGRVEALAEGAREGGLDF